MDANLLLECFSATLQADQNIRRQGELKLKELSETPGFLGACLDIIASGDGEVQPPVKKATAVYFKNRVIRYWSSKESRIDPGERPVVKERILPVIIHCDYTTKQQLIPVLRVMISQDFSKWDGLLERTGALLQQVPVASDPSIKPKDEEYSNLYTGLLCFSEITRRFKWIENSQREADLDPIIELAFPHLLSIGKSIIEHSENLTELTAEILKLILKCYKFVTYYDLPKPLQTRSSILLWGEFHGLIINMKPPAYVLNSNLTEQEKSFLQISKCYKRSIANLYRIFTRYASKSLTKKFKYKEFHQLFLNDFIPHLLTNYLSIIEQWCGGSRWLSSNTLFCLIEFLSHCITQKTTAALIKPYFENLVSHLVYPLLCPTDITLEVFDEDPHEYINCYFDINDEFNSPDIAALGLLVTFVDKKKESCLEPVLAFINNQLSELQGMEENLEVAKKKEGNLRMLGCLSTYLLKPEYEERMELFLTNLVIPNIDSKFEFLKSRTLEIMSKFADINFKNEDVLIRVFQGILINFDTTVNQDVSIVVSFQAALSIQSYLQNTNFKQILSNIILPTMSRLLELSNELDNDSISMVMQECVENFSEQLQPFGIDLMTKLVQQFMKLAVEINDASNVDIDAFDGDYDDQSDKVMAAIGLLNTMITILLSFENSKEICLKLEEVISPMVQYVLSNQLDDFLTEIAELLENSSFLLRSISPVMWKNFEYLYQSFENGLALMYLEELNGCLQNFLIFGANDLAKSPVLIEKFFNIFKIITESDDETVGWNDFLYALEFAQSFVLSLQGNARNQIPFFINSIVKFEQESKQSADSGHVKSLAFNINITNVMLSCIMYDSTTTLHLLQEMSVLSSFFEQWFTLIPKLKRVYDLKLSVLGIISILSIEDIHKLFDEQVVAQFSHKLVTLIKGLPMAIENLEKKRKNFNELEYSESFKYNGEWGNDNQWDDNDSEDLETILREGEEAATEEYNQNEAGFSQGREEYLDFLQEEEFKSSGYYSEYDDAVLEDPLATTPLDTVNVFGVFKDFAEGLERNNPTKYGLVLGNLSDDEKNVVAEIFRTVSH
ncbi:ARM repeat-containing protein [Suhomyces tanzawaensis NRRL Y-17324]|uniref:ARM repeat-containing protein n=1 Tax=Suhomyces tanzawaensis NRRL Y-17324 TaxID=984487 RepID=A0A1E4SE27_9ASCO|nr:ARM repeat-containing protein [Suhomyces tanzawaensis NRRL Y-17324]ODV77765.1 ARM repeat-containing protein [Suhomyces tanzawaensis NRRL Y-17324]